MPLVSVVIPAFNEAATLPIFYEHLIKALDPLENAGKVRFELLFVNNGSSDGTLAFLEELRAKDPRVKIATLSRNFGYQAAITAGLTLSRGDAVACIDSDGEDPPSVLAMFIERWLEGGVMRVLGASSRQLRLAQLTEFASIGLIAGTTAELAAALVSGVIAREVFDLPWQPDWRLAVAGAGAGMLAVTVTGLWATRRVAQVAPSVTLREL